MLKIRTWVVTQAILAMIHHWTVLIDLVDLILWYQTPIPPPPMAKVVTVTTKDDAPEGEVIETPWTL
jgi:hypothetical protein